MAPSPAKNRKPLFITAAATVAVLTVIAVIVAFLLSKGEDGPTGNPDGSPTDVAKAYLEALAQGDAQAALDLSATQPATTDWLTDDILKLQLEKLPITEVQVIGEEKKPDADERTSVVKVAAKFGGQRTEGELNMVVVDNQWKLSAAFVDATTQEIHGFGYDEEVDALRVFGKPLPQSRHFYVFPGYLEIKSSTPYLNINELPPTTLDDVTALKDTSVKPKYSMTDEGMPAAEQAVRAWVDNCFNGGKNTGECEGAINGNWGEDYELSTMRVRGPIDLSEANLRLADDASGPLVYTSSIRVPFSVVEKGTGRVIEDTLYFSDKLKVNLGVQPPKAFVDTGR
ncbi:hypothetical protein VST63_10825 [Mycolicibacterium sp. 050232]|uniref:hypothetical protein n=1 Tax=Mycolicibacterium sp. 050232 TaxID=3113982 RepID=UPI002E2C4F9A|nr:hypothetical protein [Mycolicibacterium sp. 050232]MED5812854.1 hypothetical protein [Mycolicibacterium sp. 050232]